MFTGIIEEVGKVTEIINRGKSMQLTITANEITKKISIGDSIAVNGVCLTVKNFNDTKFHADVSPETFKITNLKNLKFNDFVNLETALTLSKPLGGHIVSGHIDAIGKILNIKKVDDFTKFTIDIPGNLRKYMIKKGSIAIDGISLTINEISDYSFNLMIIPHTLSNTTLHLKKIGDYVNLEVDIVGKYIENFLVFKDKTGITEDFLRKHGY